MLTIKEPITLKTNRPIQGIRQDMNEKMMANYGLMNLSIRKEELLHITSKPPEIYFAEGDLLQIKTNIQNENLQEIRLDVVNNLLNRILAANTDNFTYQDTIYISNVLRKLGIRDEKTFMKQVFELQKEQRETRQLLQKYEENQKVLQQLFLMEDEQAKDSQEKKEVLHEKERRLFLHNEIFKRLETGKIYQDIRKFSKNIRNESQEIYPLEMQIAEQARAAQNLLLQNIKSEITNQNIPISYVHHNRYEYLQEMTEEITQELEEQISAAILLNLADQSYSLRQEQIEENSHQWYSIAGALFQSAENTWKRYEANLMERKHVSEAFYQILEESNHVKHLENEVINSIVEEYDRSIRIWQEENQKLQEFLIQRNTTQQDNRNIFLSGGSYHLTREELELHYLTSEGETKEEANVITTEQLQRQLDILNRKNYENYQKITEIGKQIPSVKERKVNRKKAQLDALRAMENREEVLMEYLADDRKNLVAEIQNHTKKQIYELFSEETREIYRQFLQQNTNVENAFLQQIMEQSQESEKQSAVIQFLQQNEQEEIYNLIKEERTQAAEEMNKNRDVAMSAEQLRNYLEIYQQKEHEYIRETKQEQNRLLELKNKEVYRLEETIRDVQIQEGLEPEFQKGYDSDKDRQMAEIWKKIEKQVVPFFSDKTRNVYQQFSVQKGKEETTFLQHVIEQRAESELLKEVIEILKYVERQNTGIKTEYKILESSKYLKPVVTQKVKNEIQKQIMVFRELQREMPVWEAEEVFTSKETKEISYIQENNLAELKEAIENQIIRQQMEKSVSENKSMREIVNRQIDFIYKTEQTLNNEELLEEIRMQNQRTLKTKQTEEQTIRNERDVKKIVQESVNHMQINRTEDIEELVQQSVRRQLNNLSEQVYGKLEKKLQTERKRRGYF